MKIRKIYRETWINKSIEEVFIFLSDPHNLLRITPSFIPINLVNIPDKMKQGAIIDLKMKLFKVLPVHWRTVIENWNPPLSFVDVQTKGPYRMWKHTHLLQEMNNGTLIIDQVEFVVPGYFFEPLIFHLFVKNNLEILFDYRQMKYLDLLSGFT